jgi:hypothetical protein
MTQFGNNLLACGYETAFTFSIDTISVNHPAKGGHLLGCFDLDGNIKWIREGVSRTGAHSANNVMTDRMGNIFITGTAGDTVDFDGTRLVFLPYSWNMFLCKYTIEGDILWARQSYGVQAAEGSGVSVDSAGNCYVTGSFGGTTVFDQDTLISDTWQDLFLARYDPNGNCMGAIHFGIANGVSVGQDQEGNPYLVGLFRDNISFGQTTFQSYGDWDVFVAKCGAITGMGEEKTTPSNQLIIYANPNEGKCTVTLPEEFRYEQDLILSIYNNQGKLIRQAPVTITGHKVSLNISAEAKGIYTAILTNGKKNYYGKIILR